MAGTGVVVKNTFLEVGDHLPLLRSDGWRRQISEPAQLYAEYGAGLLGGAEPYEAGVEPLAALPTVEPQVGAVLASPPPPRGTDPPCAPGGALQPTTSRMPKVLLLSESIPFKQERPVERERKGASRDGHINQMKDNSITKEEPPWTGVTTVMMRNLPNKYKQQMLLEELQDSGFRILHDFDFFYIPMDHNNAANLGYCFINFVKTALANSFAAAFQGKKMRRFNSNKTVVVMPASVQGYERNYAYYASTRVVQAEDPQYRPLFLRPPADTSQAPTSGPSPVKGTGRGRGSGKNANRESNRPSGRGNKGAGAPPRGQEAPVAPVQQPVDDWMGNNMGTGWPTMQPMVQRRVCPACNNECAPSHRFCAFCGADQMSDGSGLCADVSPFNSSLSPSYAPESGGSILSSQPEAPWSAFSGGPSSPEGVTDELDVMRGRMVLLAALRDMRGREIGAFDSPMHAPMAAAPGGQMLAQPGGHEDFLGVLSC